MVAGAGCCAGADARALDGSVESEPTSCSTTGAFANGSGGVWGDCVGDGATCECLSLITGTLWAALTTFRVRGTAGSDDGLAAGSAAGMWSAGTRRVGAATFGSDRDGSGVTDAGTPGCRKTRMSGPM